MSDKFYCFQPDCALPASSGAGSRSFSRCQSHSSDFYFSYLLWLLYLGAPGVRLLGAESGVHLLGDWPLDIAPANMMLPCLKSSSSSCVKPHSISPPTGWILKIAMSTSPAKLLYQPAKGRRQAARHGRFRHPLEEHPAQLGSAKRANVLPPV